MVPRLGDRGETASLGRPRHHDSPGHQGSTRFGRFPRHLWQNRRVKIGRDRDAGVPQHRRCRLHVVAGRQGECRRAMAQIVQPDRRQTGRERQPLEMLADPVKRQSTTWCPASMASRAMVLPMYPLPMNPTVVIFSVSLQKSRNLVIC